MPSKLKPGAYDCMAAALPDEEYFVLLARDPLMPWLLAIWASARLGDLKSAMQNFQLMFGEGLLQHYIENPDSGKATEAIASAERARAWRHRNLMPGLAPTWKRSPTERENLEHAPPYNGGVPQRTGDYQGERELPDETHGTCS